MYVRSVQPLVLVWELFAATEELYFECYSVPFSPTLRYTESGFILVILNDSGTVRNYHLRALAHRHLSVSWHLSLVWSPVLSITSPTQKLHASRCLEQKSLLQQDKKKKMHLKKSSVIPLVTCRIKYCDTSANLPQCGAFTLWPWHVINHTFCMATGPGILQPTPLNQCSHSEWMTCLGNTYYKHKNATPGRLENFYHWNLKSCLFLPRYCMSVFISYFYCLNINRALLSSEEWFSW